GAPSTAVLRGGSVTDRSTDRSDASGPPTPEGRGAEPVPALPDFTAGARDAGRDGPGGPAGRDDTGGHHDPRARSDAGRGPLLAPLLGGGAPPVAGGSTDGSDASGPPTPEGRGAEPVPALPDFPAGPRDAGRDGPGGPAGRDDTGGHDDPGARSDAGRGSLLALLLGGGALLVAV